MTAAAGKYAGMDRFETRKKIVEDMQALGLIDRIEPYRHAVGLCYRCKTVVEPLVSKQWYVNVKPLAEVALAAAHDGRITIVPSGWTKTYDQWMENIHPWCISRQLWWGHRIPAWYCDKDGSIHVSRTDLSACPQCGGPLRQDPDVLDTWFSSGLWPFSTLGWPDETLELRKYYPTSVLVTGFDIIFFWVARMAMLGLHFMKEEPFRDVYIHALVRDAEGQKMSKSKGNVVDPARDHDQVRDRRVPLHAGRAGRPGPRHPDQRRARRGLPQLRQQAVERLAPGAVESRRLRSARATARPPGCRAAGSRAGCRRRSPAVREALDGYRYNDAAAALYQFLWNDFCDWYLEIAKTALYRAGEPAERQRVQHTLVTVLETTLRLLHPFMPFITEDIWQRLPHVGESIMVAPYPRADAALASPDAERAMSLLMQTVTAIRNIRGEMRISPAQMLTVTVKAAAADESLLREYASLVETLARARVTVDPGATRPRASALGVAGQSELYVELAGLVDLAAERTRLDKEIKRTAEVIAFTRGKLARPDFTERAPAEVVEKEREKLAEHQALHDKLVASLSWIG